ncbi:MAG: hypothetical protein PHC60_03035 [Heliobacteriaceae bacterium]|nr:hypothetical protein [Heliobacteriaceae bacterium]
MINGITGDGRPHPCLRARVRFDFRTPVKKARFFFSGIPLDKQAEDLRDQQIALLRNVPIQGVEIEDIDLGAEVYVLIDEKTGREVAFAPVILTVRTDSLEDLLRFTIREEFRKVELLAPDQLMLNRFDLERFIYRVHEEQQKYQQILERRLAAR